jgi:hypothetical protein
MGKTIKELNVLTSLETNDKILVDRNGKGYAINLSEVLASTEIDDIETIRNGAAKGATALQSVPSEYVTESELTAKGYLTSHQDISHLATKTELNNFVTNDDVETMINNAITTVLNTEV